MRRQLSGLAGLAAVSMLVSGCTALEGCGNSRLDRELNEALSRGDLERAEVLVEQGADVDAVFNFTGGMTNLHYAATAGDPMLARWLLEHGADPDVRVSNGWTPLIIAAEHGHAEHVRLLLEHGADPTLVDEQGRTALDHATERGDQQVVALLDEATR